MKKVIKWIAVTVAGLLVLAVAFTAIFVVIPLSRSVRNLKENKNEATSLSQTTAENAVTEAPQPAEDPFAAEKAALEAKQAETERMMREMMELKAKLDAQLNQNKDNSAE